MNILKVGNIALNLSCLHAVCASLETAKGVHASLNELSRRMKWFKPRDNKGRFGSQTNLCSWAFMMVDRVCII